MPPKKEAAPPPVTDTSKFAYIDCSLFEENMKLTVSTNCSYNLLFHNTKAQCLKVVNDKLNKLKANASAPQADVEALSALKELLSGPNLDLIDSEGNAVSKSPRQSDQAYDVLKARKEYKFLVNNP